MCGFCGVFYADGMPGDVSQQLTAMSRQLIHRGPDDSGSWMDPESGIALAHRRLAVIDLSPAGHQPMLSASGRYVIAYNGEIYNHLQLRKNLEKVGKAPEWRGHSDTETLLAAIEAWGLKKALQESVGMFALALWDRASRSLFLARDRLGEKPLYYGWQGKTFLFGSDLAALRPHPAFVGEIDRGALTLFLRHNYIPTPYAIYRGIKKLPPGTVLKLAVEVVKPPTLPAPESYWHLNDVVARGYAQPFSGTDSEAVTALEDLLRKAIGQQMIADVPLGAFLSGGIDSSTVVALMQALSNRPVKTFTIGFSEKGYDEAIYAKKVARHLGTEHTELYVSPDKARDVIPRLPSLYSEPFADSSQIPTFLVSQMTREHVTVALSGDGGDELFGGYNRYFLMQRLWHKLRLVPAPIRKLIARGILAIPPNRWEKIMAGVPGRLLGARLSQPGDKMHKLAAILGAQDPYAIYLRLVSHFKQPAEIVKGGQEPSTILTDRSRWAAVDGIEAHMMYLDALSYLPDDILVKVDRAAMGVSLETRVPFLDHRIVAFAWSLPLAKKIREGRGKWILRQVLQRYVPTTLIERPKMGFGIPLDSWLRGPLREWAEELIDETRLRNEGFFDPVPIREKWTEHVSGRRNWQYHLWDILMFQSWLEHVKQDTIPGG